MIIFFLLSFLYTNSQAENLIINNLKTKKLVLDSSIVKKLNKKKNIKVLERKDFPLKIQKLYDDFNFSLPHAFLVDFNKDQITDVVFMVKDVRSDKLGYILAAVSTKKRYKIITVDKIDFVTTKDIEPEKLKDGGAVKVFNYLVAKNPKKIENKPVILETFLDQQRKYRFDSKKMVFKQIK